MFSFYFTESGLSAGVIVGYIVLALVILLILLCFCGCCQCSNCGMGTGNVKRRVFIDSGSNGLSLVSTGRIGKPQQNLPLGYEIDYEEWFNKVIANIKH